jgi:uncharacterized protein
MKKPVFLKARWEYLLMFNYEVDPKILRPYLPAFTEFDLWQGKVLVSVVGFLFNDTRVLGIRWPMHTNFEEVNLRFYIRHRDGKQWKRAVTFVSEIVPRPLIAVMANALFNERYSAGSMSHKIVSEANSLNISYDWKLPQTLWNSMSMECENKPTPIIPGSAEEFIFEHYYGYNKVNSRRTIEYSLEHPVWKVYPVKKYSLQCDIAALYGSGFERFINGVPPHSVMAARGSEILLRMPSNITGK